MRDTGCEMRDLVSPAFSTTDGSSRCFRPAASHCCASRFKASRIPSLASRIKMSEAGRSISDCSETMPITSASWSAWAGVGHVLRRPGERCYGLTITASRANLGIVARGKRGCLLLYNTMFILPRLIALTLTFSGLHPETLLKWPQGSRLRQACAGPAVLPGNGGAHCLDEEASKTYRGAKSCRFEAPDSLQ